MISFSPQNHQNSHSSTSMAPPNTTIILQRDNVGPDWLVGIDLQFFTVQSTIYGIKNVPDGLHFFHYGSDELNRHGVWIDCENETIVVLQWNEEKQALHRIDKDPLEELNVSKMTTNLGGMYSYMVDFREPLAGDEAQRRLLDQSLANWRNALTNYIDIQLITDIIGESGETSTMDATKQENDQLKQKIELTERELHYKPIALRKVSKGKTPEEITANSIDKTWYVEELFGRKQLASNVLGEMQISFVHFLTLGSYSSVSQWSHILVLVLQSEKLMTRWNTFGRPFMINFMTHLTTIPEEYLLESTAVVDISLIHEALTNFKRIFDDIKWNSGRCCGDLKRNGSMLMEWQKLVEIMKAKFHYDVDEEEEEEEGPTIVD